MKAIFYDAFMQRPQIANLPDPTPHDNSVVIAVKATGVCRSDWHGWMGHDSDIKLPHVPGHEFAGDIVAVGKNITSFKEGDRVTVPFVSGCGHCSECNSGNQQVCPNQFQPGFTHWGSFAQFVEIDYAQTNLVHLPDSVDYSTAASLGCRFATSFRAVVDQACLKPGEWIAIHGAGGVGLSAIMIAASLGALPIAIDISDDKLEFAKQCGAIATINSTKVADVSEAVKDISKGGAHVSIDALGNPVTCFNSIKNLRRRGRHVQVGLMLADHSTPKIPMAAVIAHELEIYGSHGMQAWRYDAMLDMILAGTIKPQQLIGQFITLEQGIDALVSMDKSTNIGMSIINSF